MQRSAFFIGFLLLAAVGLHAARGDLFLDLGAGTMIQERGRQPAMAGNMGFHYGANDWTQLSLGVDYGRFLSYGGSHQVDLTGVSVASYLTPYPGDIEPLIGAHFGMTRVDETWRVDLGLEAQALANLHDRFQGYVAVDPGIWLGEGAPEIWVKLGLGIRVRLGY